MQKHFFLIVFNGVCSSVNMSVTIVVLSPGLLLTLRPPPATRRHSRSTSALSSAECYSGDQRGLLRKQINSLSQIKQQRLSPGVLLGFPPSYFLFIYLADWVMLLIEASPCMAQVHLLAQCLVDRVGNNQHFICQSESSLPANAAAKPERT